MKSQTKAHLERFFREHPHLSGIREEIMTAVSLLIAAYENGNKVLICGNGGSASDSEHIVGELMKGFLLKRPLPEQEKQRLTEELGEELGGRIGASLQGALPAISLVSHTALSTAFSNDVDPQMVFAQQVYGYQKPGDVLIGISTSGNSENVVLAAATTRACGMETIAMTGSGDSRLSELCSVTLRAPETETFKIQEDHLKLYHLLCAVTELELFDC